jgi:sulfite dehydrogenase (cytochrome) subunit B
VQLASIALMMAFSTFTGLSATAEEKPVRLKQAQGLDKVEAQCSACHSLDYVQMNSPFLSAAGWGEHEHGN